MKISIIKSKKQYKNYLAEIEALVLDDSHSVEKDDRIDLLKLVISTYENEKYKFEKPNAIEAIKYRMAEQDLSQKDLIPFIGSRSKVSEVLSGKRNLSIEMVRSLSKGLNISSDVLLVNEEKQRTVYEIISDETVDLNKVFPVKEMIQEKWISKKVYNIKECLIDFFKPVKDEKLFALCRLTPTRTGKSVDSNSLLIWVAKTLLEAKELPDLPDYVSGTVNTEFLSTIAQFSKFDDGPFLARKHLLNNGIALVFVKQLKKTKLDGAALLMDSGNPVISMTLRYDRLDNFWFTLMHELVHIGWHLEKMDAADRYFFDDFDIDYDTNEYELEADRLAREAFIPRYKWKRSKAYRTMDKRDIENMATELSIHPTIIAGRIRYEKNNYKILNNFIVRDTLREKFLKQPVSNNNGL